MSDDPRYRPALRLAPFAAGALLASTALSPAQNALPGGGVVTSGAATIGKPTAGAMTINQSSSRAVVDWNSFSIGAGNSVTFQQPNAGAAVLNRVDGSAPSTIAGQLNGNGQVFLINPNGVAITKSGAVSVGGGFVGSTLGVSNDDFMAGRLNFTGGGNSAAVSNAGTIKTGAGGFVGLLGGQVTNSGTVISPVGSVGMGAGEAATLDLSGDQFLQVVVPTSTAGRSGALIDVSGKVVAPGGRIEIKAAAAQQAARDVVNISGALSASSAHREGGTIVLDGGGGSVAVTGKLTARSKKSHGGKVVIGGDSVTLRGAIVDASGATGGGTIAIGGGSHGANAGATVAETVSVDAGTTIRADALKDGDGGLVTLWGDEATSFAGTISAQALGASGNGGSAEVSGAALAYAGTTNLLAAHGVAGTLLLDPYDVTISTSADSNYSGFVANGDSANINTTTLATALATANIVISTGASGSQNGDITVSSPVTWTSANSLTLSAYRNINVNANLAGGSGATVTLAADNTGTERGRSALPAA